MTGDTALVKRHVEGEVRIAELKQWIANAGIERTARYDARQVLQADETSLSI